MDYKKHYDALIERAKVRKLSVPSESHHIVPRCMGGKDGKKNEVDLTPEEHYLAHLLLVRIFPETQGLILAAVLMSRDNRNGKRSNNKMYGWLRKRAREADSIRRTGIPLSAETRAKISAVLKASPAHAANIASMRGVPIREEVRRKVSESHKTSEAARAARERLFQLKVGVPRSEACKAKISAANSGRITPEIERQKISSALKGVPKSPEHNAKVSAALKGRKGTMTGRQHSEETKTRMRAAALGRKMKPEDIVKMVQNKTPEQRRAQALKAWETKRAKKAAEQA